MSDSKPKYVKKTRRGKVIMVDAQIIRWRRKRRKAKASAKTERKLQLEHEEKTTVRGRKWLDLYDAES